MASCTHGSQVEHRALLALLAATLLALQLLPRAAAVPPRYTPDSQRDDDHECLLQENTEALCQRCAKSTRSTMVYPMCCRDQEEVRAWCVRYLDYGLQ